MADIKETTLLAVTPGVKRDGTLVDGDNYSEAQWVRFQRGKPKKMKGYQMITESLAGPIRQTLVWSRGLMNAIYTFSSNHVQSLLVDNNGLGAAVYTRTPVGFVAHENNIWSVDTMYDDAVGSQGTIIVAVATQSLNNIDNDIQSQVYYGLANEPEVPLLPIDTLFVSGGILCIAPYLVYFGSDGRVGWSDINQPQTLNTGDAGQDRVTGAKVVKGLPVRGANGPSALLWSLDSLISMQYVGGAAIFRFTTITAQTSILAQNSPIEYDGSFFWIGVDRFLVFTGGQVQELPNQMNLNWFFDNLNYEHRQKVWAMKIPRFGEIWWFYPRGEATECTHAVIFNVREKTWYDCELARSSGYYSQVFHYPVMTNSIPNTTGEIITITIASGVFNDGNEVLGTTSGSKGSIIRKLSPTTFQVRMNLPGMTFTELEGLQNLSEIGVGTVVEVAQIYAAFIHERGLNKIVGDKETAIEATFTTCDFGYPTGGMGPPAPKGLNRWTRLVRIEPDFVQAGNMTVEVIGREWPEGEDTVSPPFTFAPNTDKIDMREQRRLIRLRFTSNEVNGNFEMGRTILHTEPGDVRS